VLMPGAAGTANASLAELHAPHLPVYISCCRRVCNLRAQWSTGASADVHMLARLCWSPGQRRLSHGSGWDVAADPSGGSSTSSWTVSVLARLLWTLCYADTHKRGSVSGIRASWLTHVQQMPRVKTYVHRKPHTSRKRCTLSSGSRLPAGRQG
jgi:hypothetical protein